MDASIIQPKFFRFYAKWNAISAARLIQQRDVNFRYNVWKFTFTFLKSAFWEIGPEKHAVKLNDVEWMQTIAEKEGASWYVEGGCFAKYSSGVKWNEDGNEKVSKIMF